MAGRRGDHNREEFTALVLGAAERIAVAEGLRGLGLRKIASAVGYAPNSIYNALGDLDEIIGRVNARTVENLRTCLEAAIVPGQDPTEQVVHLAEAYLGFVLAKPRLWSLLFEHTLPEGRSGPAELAAALTRTTGLVEQALAPLFPREAARLEAVAALWASLHGIASLAVTGKLSAVSAADPYDLVRLLVRTFLAGAGASKAKR